jgi:hypothetical protein
MNKLRVLYIGGTGRTGSTLLDQLLGQFPGWFSGGEMAFFWSRGIKEHAICACGTQVRDCVVWSDALADGTGPVDTRADRMITARRSFWSVHLPAMVIPGFARRRMSSLRDFTETNERLYRRAAANRNASVLIDSSKEPHYAYILREGTDLPISFLHLVRDPRAVGFSWLRRKQEAGLATGEFMEQRGPLVSSIYYLVSNIAAELLWRTHDESYRFLRYEDFVADPLRALDAIGTFVGDPVSASEIIRCSTFDISESHTSWGNPGRVGRTEVTIRADESWKTGLSRWQKFALTACTLPLLLRYGYPIRPSGMRLENPRASRLRRSNIA